MKCLKNTLVISVIMTALFLPAVGNSKHVWTDCGIGALIFKETAWAAVTSSIIWDLGPTGSSSTSSSEDQCAGKGASTAHFIYENYALLEEETAAGEGAHLVTMLYILGCEGSTHQEIINSLRTDFGKSIQNSSYLSGSRRQKAKAYYDNVVGTTANKFIQQCSVI